MNNGDFKCFLKVGRELLTFSWAGIVLHTVVAATQEAHLCSNVSYLLAYVYIGVLPFDIIIMSNNLLSSLSNQ